MSTTTTTTTTMNTKDPRTKPLKRINSRKIESVLENGDIHDRDNVTCWLDPRGTPQFCYLVPEYVAHAMEIKDGIVKGATAEEAYTNYKAVLYKYQEHARTTNAEPVFIVRLGYYGRDENGNFLKRPRDERYGVDYNGSNDEARVSLRYTRAFRVGKSIFSALETDEGSFGEFKGYKPGARIGYVDGFVMDYNPGLEIKLQQVHYAITAAARMLSEIACSENVQAALMGLGMKLLPTLPAPKG